MKTKFMKISVFAFVALLALGAIGLGVAYAQTETPSGMMDGFFGQQGSSGQMADMHNWMTKTGGMHTLVWVSLAKALDLTTDELDAEMNSGKTLTALADEKGFDRSALLAELEKAHQAGLAQAVVDGISTQEQTDAMLNQMSGRYEWMIDNMGASAGYGMMGGRGRMMGSSFGQQGSNGQFGPGGCHGNYAPAASQNTP